MNLRTKNNLIIIPILLMIMGIFLLEFVLANEKIKVNKNCENIVFENKTKTMQMHKNKLNIHYQNNQEYLISSNDKNIKILEIGGQN